MRIAGVVPGTPSRCRFDQSVSGAAASQDCQARITSGARDQVNWRNASASDEIGRVRSTSDVTTPKLPAPAPRSAQKSSGSRRSSQVSRRPSAVTMSALARLSHVRPQPRDSTPTPPPSVSPAMPTVGHDPAAIPTPAAASAA